MNKQNLNITEEKLEKLISSAQLKGEKTTVDNVFAEKLKEELLNSYLTSERNKMGKIREFLNSKVGKMLSLSALSLTIVVSLGFAIVYYYIASKAPNLKETENENETVTIAKLGGNLAIVEGTVEISEDLEDWVTAEEGAKINEGDAIKTGAGSKAVVEIDDGSAVRLNENSEVQFVTLTANTIVIDQVAGESYHRVEKDDSREYIVTSAENNEDFKVTAMGTAFDVNWNDETVKCLESKVRVRYAAGQPEELVEEGNEFKLGETAEVKTIEGESLDTDWYTFNKTQDKEVNANLGVFENETAPSLEITEPVNGFETTNEKVTLKGTTEAANTVKVKVGENWEIAADNSGSFEKEVSLSIGDNSFEVKAYSPSGLKTIKTVTIKRKQATTQKPVEVPDNPVIETIITTSLTSPEPGKISVSWQLNGAEKAGYKVVFSKNANPEYPNREGDYYNYISGGGERSATFAHNALAAGGTFHVRVCRYWAGEDGKSCDIYTQNLTVEVAAKQTQSEEWGTVGITLTQSGSTLNWTITGTGSTKSGFKIVWDKVENPTYPKSANSNATESWGYVYLGESTARSYSFETPTESGTYHIRVGRYLGGSCDIYSNQITVVVP